MGRLHLELLLPAVALETRTVSPAAVQRLVETLEREIAHWTPFKVFARLLLPVATKSAEKFARGQACVDLARMACALGRHHLAHGSYPGSLDALTPTLLPKLPHDVIKGEPLKYRRTDDGRFALHSVGWNESDDGGEVGLTEKGTFTWSKGDWLWHYPVK